MPHAPDPGCGRGRSREFHTEQRAAGLSGVTAADSTLQYRFSAEPEAALQSGVAMLSGIAHRGADDTVIALKLKGILHVAA